MPRLNTTSTTSESPPVNSNNDSGDNSSADSVDDALVSRDNMPPLEVTAIEKPKLDKGVNIKFKGQGTKTDKSNVSSPTPSKKHTITGSPIKKGKSSVAPPLRQKITLRRALKIGDGIKHAKTPMTSNNIT